VFGDGPGKEFPDRRGRYGPQKSTLRGLCALIGLHASLSERARERERERERVWIQMLAEREMEDERFGGGW
jgi:hypothetical protein